MTCGRVLQYKTQQGGLNTRWFMSHYEFRMECDPLPLSATGWFKKYKVVYDFRMGCDPPLLQQGGSNKKIP